MSNYSLLERKIAGILSKFPAVKLFIKKNYQRLNYLLHKKSYTYQCNYDIKELSYQGEESFFGYYDKSPINKSNRYVIFQSVSFSTKQLPEIEKGVSIILYDIELDKYEKIDTSYAYNWQQGTKLMWINENEFIYNNFDKEGKKYISKIYNVATKETKVIAYPIYDATDKFAISLNFERLNIGRGDYTYFNLNSQINWNDNKNDGLFYIDLSYNSSKLILSLEQIIKLNYKDSMQNAKHKFNHIMISPNQQKMMFMHRWFLPNGQRFDSLYVSNIDGTDIKLIADDGMVSHCCWRNDNEIIAYLRDKAIGDKFYLIDVNSRKKVEVGKSKLEKFGDGHPSCIGNKMIFDTYPDKSRMKELFLYDLKEDSLVKLGEFYESMKYYGETRCDLHPKYSQDGKMIFIDSVHTGKRKLHYLKLEK